MTLKLHLISGAPRPWRVQLGLTFKELDYETRYLEASKGEHKSEPFLSLSPRGTVPVLETGTMVLRDSIGILAWLDRQYPEKPLFGDTPDEAALIWQITLECCDYLRTAGQKLLFPILVQNKPLPDKASAEFADLKAAADLMHAESRWLNELLADRPFLAGDHPTAADAVAFPEIRLMQRAVERKHEIMEPLGFGYPPDLYPRVADWKARVAALPGVEKTLPVHW